GAFGVRDGDRRVVERRVDVGQPVMDDALLAALLERLLLRLARALLPTGRVGLDGRVDRFDFCHKNLAETYIVFFFATAPLRGPFRVRAFVLVRCPRTGRLRRWRRPRQLPISISRLMFIETSLRRSPSTLPCSSMTRLIFRTSSSDRSLMRMSPLTPAAVRMSFERFRPIP